MPKWFIGPNVWITTLMIPTDAAYLAGFIDGEGTIGICKARRREQRVGYRLQPYLSVANTDFAALERLQGICGGRIVQCTNPLKPHHKTGYLLRLQPNQMRHVLPQIRPYLVIKARQADYLMQFLKINIGGRHVNTDQQVKLDELREVVRGLNARGVQTVQ